METKKQELKKEMLFKIEYADGIRRIYFNRFSFQHKDGVKRITVWYQDEFMRISNAYSFVFDDEDFSECSSGIKNYIQRILNRSNVEDATAEVDFSSSVNVATVDVARMIKCAYASSRAEICLGFIPLVSMGSRMDSSEPGTATFDVALCSKIGCHVELLRRMVEK